VCRAWGQNPPEAAAIKLIRETAADICTTVPTEGSNGSVELTSSAKAKLDGAVAKFVNLGVEGAAKYQSEQYKGVLRVDLAQAINAANNCKLTVFNTLIAKMRLAPPAAALHAPDSSAAISSTRPDPGTEFRKSISGLWRLDTSKVTGSYDCLYHDTDFWSIEGLADGILLHRILKHDVSDFSHCSQSNAEMEFTNCASDLELLTAVSNSNSSTSIQFESIGAWGHEALNRSYVKGLGRQEGENYCIARVPVAGFKGRLTKISESHIKLESHSPEINVILSKQN